MLDWIKIRSVQKDADAERWWCLSVEKPWNGTRRGESFLMNVSEKDGLTPELREPLASRRKLFLYFFPLLLAPILIIGAGFVLTPTRWFTLRSGNTYMANLAYADRLRNSDCKVILYGDSTALTGLDPLLIQARTGLKTCNIAEFEGMTSINQTMLVDRYLAHNPRPEFIVFWYSPDDLNVPPDWKKVSSFEAETWRAQQGYDPATIRLFLAHPVEVLSWAEQGARMSLLRFRSKPFGEDRLHVREPYQGRLVVPGTTLVNCDGIRHDDPPNDVWLAHLRSYGVEGTQVIVDANPAPPCEASLDFYRKSLTGKVDDYPLPVYPVNVFVDHSRNHMNEDGAKLVSNLVADQLLSRMKTDGPRAQAFAEPGLRGGR